MSTKLPGYDETVVCPYNKCHVILKHRIQTHLVKCARSYPNIKLETCPFDVSHRFPPQEKLSHIEKCPSRENFDRYVYRIGNENERKAEAPRPRPTPPPPPRANDDEENWDHYNAPTYDPQQYVQNARVLRTPGLMTPSERRLFADKERQRLSELDRRRRE